MYTRDPVTGSGGLIEIDPRPLMEADDDISPLGGVVAAATGVGDVDAGAGAKVMYGSVIDARVYPIGAGGISHGTTLCTYA